jgi:isoleucyl-tRNA synthetase
MHKNPKKAHGRKNEEVEVVTTVDKSEVALREEQIQAFWEEQDIFNKSVITPAGGAPKGNFVFYDGPPFATGLPHYGHILAGTIKDAIPRFWTMNGYRVRRKWGWDCHGLPLENLIEKKLGLATKRDIEEFGVQNFNEAARDAVMEYADDWKQIIPRMGRWADMEDDYKTMDSTYTESVWWVFKQLHEKGLVFEGFKTMHLCPRCGTTLSNFEVNQGYKDIKDIAVTVKLPLLDEAGAVTDTSLLVWTTTPWTLPGNLAAAVNQEFTYVKVKLTIEAVEDFVILAKDRLVQLDGMEVEIVEEIKGSDLVGRRYQSPFPWMVEQSFEGKENAWVIQHADYVEIGEDGTGAVHIAPAFGDDDMKLAQEHGVPIVHHVNESGHFHDWVTDFAGQLVKPKDDADSGVTHLDSDIEIVKALKANGTLLKKENITHSYPHCWRCDTPLLNYATTSWFVDVPSIKDKLVAENDKVNWVPGHVGTNRFGKWLEGARDWAVSRQRYWGAPLPIWRNPETQEYKVFGSLAELKSYVPKSNNHYFVMRHGQSESNVAGVISANITNDDPVTEEGKQQALATAAELQNQNIDLIIVSPFMRTQQTAELVREQLGLPADAVIVDDRIREFDLADEFEGKRWHDDYAANFATWEERFTKELPGSENRRDVTRRVGDFLYDIDATYAGKNILVISHGGCIATLRCAAAGLNIEQAKEDYDSGRYFANAQLEQLDFTPLPHNDNYELDFHRPYIDDIAIEEDGVRLERVLDVFDCWFESGSMPYGQRHFMGEPQSEFDPENNIGLPAQFIAEGLDQTRGWFYSLMVLGTALFGKSPYENVIVNGMIMAEDGKKLSKKLQNYSAPMDLADRVGADSMRQYLLNSPVIRGEDLHFSDQEVLELQRKNIGRLHNVLAMYEMFADGTEARADSSNVLDQWIVTRLQELVNDSTAGYKSYELDKATRPIGDFIDDLSVWYLRRSRDRLKGEVVVDRTLALATLRHVLRTLALTIAPSMPFYAEYLWQAVREDEEAESVHLAAWPTEGVVNEALLEQMEETRAIVTTALEARTKSGIKVRQPIASVHGPALPDGLSSVVLDELNAKSYVVADTVAIDTNLTPELISEGAVRELMRAVQGKRKANGLEPKDEITLTVQTDDSGHAAITAYQDLLQKTVGATDVQFSDTNGDEVTAGDFIFTFSID